MNQTDKTAIATVVFGLWPRLPNTPECNLVLFGYTGGDGLHRPGIFSGFPVADVVDACRQFAIQHPGRYPSSADGAGWRKIQATLIAKRRARNPKARHEWGPCDEIAVNDIRLTAMERLRDRHCPLPPDWFTDAEFIRRNMGTNPDSFERTEAEKELNAAVDEANTRIRSRGSGRQLLRWPLTWWRDVPRDNLAADWDEWREANDSTMSELAKSAARAYARRDVREMPRGGEAVAVGGLF